MNIRIKLNRVWERGILVLAILFCYSLSINSANSEICNTSNVESDIRRKATEKNIMNSNFFFGTVDYYNNGCELLSFYICYDGDQDFENNTLFISIYDANPFLSSANVIQTYESTKDREIGECHETIISVSNFGDDFIYGVLNDNGSSSTPFDMINDFPNTGFIETNHEDNLFEFDLADCSPIEICDNGIDDDGDGLVDCEDDDCCGELGCEDNLVDFYIPNTFVVLPDCQTLFLNICNESAQSFNGTIPVSLYDAVPELVTSTYQGTFDLDLDIGGNDCVEIPIDISSISELEVYYIMLNDDGSVTPPFDVSETFPVTSILECNFENNVGFYIPLALAPVQINASICQGNNYVLPDGEIITEAGVYMDTLTTQFSCDSIIITQLEVNTNCGEDCFNGMDDDGDGLIDIFDPDCQCSGPVSQFGFVQNSNFEGVEDCCEVANQTYECISDWQVIAGSPDHYSLECASLGDIPFIEESLVSSFQEPFLSIGGGNGFSESMATCLLEPLVPGINYSIEFEANLSSVWLTMFNEEVFFTVYGLPDCVPDLSSYYGQGVNNFCQTTFANSAIPLITVSSNELESLDFNTFSNTFQVPSNVEAIIVLFDCQSTSGGVGFFQVNHLQIYREEISSDWLVPFDIEVSDPCAFPLEFYVPQTDTLSYQWYLDSIPLMGEVTNTLELNANDYSTDNEFHLFVYNDNGCMLLGPVNIQLNSSVETFDTLKVCSGTDVIFNNQMLTMSGDYMASLMTVSGCDSIAHLNLSIGDNTSSNLEQSICQGETYLFNGILLNSEGVFKDTIPNSMGCDSIINLILSIDDFQTGPEEFLNLCPGETVFFGGETIIQAGIYKDTIALNAGCDSIATLIVSYQDELTYNFELNYNCDIVTLEVQPNMLINDIIIDNQSFGTQWSIADLQEGMYSITFIYGNNCSVSDQFEVSFNNVDYHLSFLDPLFDCQIITGEVCWDNVNPTINLADISLYALDSQSENLVLITTLEMNDLNNNCFSFSAVLPEFNFSDFDQILGVVNNQVQLLNLSDLQEESNYNNECSVFDNYAFLDFESQDLDLGPDVNLCAENYMISAPDGFISYDWNGVTQEKDLLVFQSGEFILTAIDRCDREYKDTIQVTLNQIDSLTETITNTCPSLSNGEIVLEVNNSSGKAYTFLWSDNLGTDNFVDNLPFGEYQVTVTNGNCNEVLEFEILEFPEMNYVIEHSEDLCYGAENGFVNISSPDNIQSIVFENESFPFPTEFNNLPAGVYDITLIDINACTEDLEIIIDESEAIEASLPDSIFINLYDDFQLELEGDLSDDIVLDWSPSNVLSCDDCADPYFIGTNSTLLSLDLIQGECMENLLVYIDVNSEIDVYIPNIFNPDSPVGNDQFGAFTNVSFDYFNMWIFDRWGNKIYEAENSEKLQYWNGRFKSEKVVSGVYAYLIEIELQTGDTRQYKGTVTVIR